MAAHDTTPVHAARPGAIASVVALPMPVRVALVALTLVTSFSVAAGIALLARRGPAVAMAKTALILSAALDVVIYTTSYFPSNRMPGDTPFYVGASLIYHGAWLAYVLVSRRVRNTY